jgi:hypothetical protein
VKKKKSISRLSVEQALRLESKTDHARLETMTADQIDFSDAPKVTPEAFARAVVRRGSAQANLKRTT